MKNKRTVSSLPLVSIGMPTYNRGHVVGRAIDSILKQTYENFELIIADNASMDNTQAVCEAYAKNDSRITYFRRLRNMGLGDNHNFTLTKSQGKYFMWANDDDVRHPEFLAKCVSRLMAEPGAVGAFCNYSQIDEQGNVRQEYVPSKFLPMSSDLYTRLKQYILLYCFDGKANVVHALWVRKKIKPWREDWGQDMNFVFVSLTRGPIVLVDEVLFFKGTSQIPFSSNPAGVLWRYLTRLVECLPLVYYYIKSIWGTDGLDFFLKVKLSGYLFFAYTRFFYRWHV
jgi:glycosyltransferase involved in cell wall biosynthesis